jgi:hypothetical protein
VASSFGREREDRLPVVLHAHDCPAIFLRGIQRFVILFPVRELAHGIVVVDHELQRWPFATLAIAEHFNVAARANIARG